MQQHHSQLFKINELSSVNICKPANENWLNSGHMPTAHPGMIAGNFNSHHQFTGFDNNDYNRDTLNEWAE